MTCNHNAFTFHYGIAFDRVSTRFCPMCSDFVPWGPANDTAEVLVEIRAAELASDQGAVLSMRLGGSAHWPHVWGWWAYRTGTPEPRDEHQAGWLAHAIWNHDAEQAETGGEG